METCKFDKEFMLGVLNEEHGEVLIDEPYDQSRWATGYLLIFKYEDKIWQTGYERGNAEGETPFEYDKEIKCVRVWPRLIQSVEYVTEDPYAISDKDDTELTNEEVASKA